MIEALLLGFCWGAGIVSGAIAAFVVIVILLGGGSKREYRKDQ